MARNRQAPPPRRRTRRNPSDSSQSQRSDLADPVSNPERLLKKSKRNQPVTRQPAPRHPREPSPPEPIPPEPSSHDSAPRNSSPREPITRPSPSHDPTSRNATPHETYHDDTHTRISALQDSSEREERPRERLFPGPSPHQPISRPSSPMFDVQEELMEQNENSQRAVIKPDPETPPDPDDVVRSKEVPDEPAQRRYDEIWRPLLELVAANSANTGQLDDLTFLKERMREELADYDEELIDPPVSQLDLAKGSAADLNTLVLQVATSILSKIWDWHVDRQTEPTAKVTAIVEMGTNLARLAAGEEYRFPGDDYDDDDTSLDFYGAIAGQPHTKKQAAKICETLGIGDNAVFEGAWNFMGSLGQGGNGHASLWVQYDNTTQVIDRVVTKEHWSRRGHWRVHINGTLAKAPNGVELPKEAYMQSLLAEKREAQSSIVDIRAWALYEKIYMYRLYLEYCEIPDDLEQVITRHSHMEDKRDQHGEHLSCPIAEIAIWAVFETLTHAIYLMKYGLPPSMLGKSVTWKKEMLHLDIKPANVFLKTPHPTIWPETPQFRLGDFGAAEFIPARHFGGTEGYRPPEQQMLSHENGSAINVWAVGANIASLIKVRRCRKIHYGMDPALVAKLVPKDPENIALFDDRDRQLYSPELLELVEFCCAEAAADRIHVRYLWEQIKHHVNEGTEPLKSRKRKREELFMYTDEPAYQRLRNKGWNGTEIAEAWGMV